jgi:hypothetical protein
MMFFTLPPYSPQNDGGKAQQDHAPDRLLGRLNGVIRPQRVAAGETHGRRMTAKNQSHDHQKRTVANGKIQIKHYPAVPRS